MQDDGNYYGGSDNFTQIGRIPRLEIFNGDFDDIVSITATFLLPKSTSSTLPETRR